MSRIIDLATDLKNAAHDGDYYVVDHSTLGTRKIPCGRKSGSTIGSYSYAEGSGTIASGNYSHAEGQNTTAAAAASHAEGQTTNVFGIASHAEGSSTTASGTASHAEGSNTKANNNYSHAEGSNTKASANMAHAEGSNTTASGVCSHSEGTGTTASNYASHAMGHYNVAMTTGGSSSNTLGSAFVIGNGTSTTSSNAFSVMFDGTVKAAGTITASTTADYAELFEFADQNPDEEDRVGRFVTFDDEDKIRIATPDDNYILGVVSGAPFVLGNGDCDVWNGMYLRDDFGRYITEPAPKVELVEVKDEDGNVVDMKEEIVPGEFEGEAFVVNPDYNPSTPYVSRMERPEWAAVGMLGVLSIYDNGECQVNRYCTVGENGIAVPVTKDNQIASGNFYRVIGRVSKNVIKIVFR